MGMRTSAAVGIAVLVALGAAPAFASRDAPGRTSKEQNAIEGCERLRSWFDDNWKKCPAVYREARQARCASPQNVNEMVKRQAKCLDPPKPAIGPPPRAAAHAPAHKPAKAAAKKKTKAHASR